MILLEDGLLGPWPIVQVIFKSYLPSKKINLFQTTAQHFFWALQELTNPTPLIFTQILLLHQRGAWISMMIRKLVKMGWLWMDFIKTTTQQYKLSQKKEIVMNCSYLSLMTMMTLMEWTSLIPLQVMKDSRLRCIYMTNCPVWKVMHQSIPSSPSPPPPRPLRDICPPCHSWRWGMSKFCAAQGSGICHPWGHPGAFDMHMVSYPKI